MRDVHPERLALALLILFSAGAAEAIQCAYPNGDEDNTTYFWDIPGSGSTHYTVIDEDTTCTYAADDATTIAEDDGSVYRALLSTVTDPESSTGHTWSCGAYRSSNKANTLTVDLYQGGTQINTATSCTGTVTNGSPAARFPAGGCTLTGTEADSITDYSDLRLYLTATGTNPTDIFVDSCALEVPNAPGGATYHAIVVN